MTGGSLTDLNYWTLRSSASHAARCVAHHGVGSHAVPVALGGECSMPVVQPRPPRSSQRGKLAASQARRVRASSALGAARRNQSNHPEQNDRPDEGGEEANDEASADHPEGHREEPAAEERAADADDQVSDHAVPMTAH